jgi:hypothetical protein
MRIQPEELQTVAGMGGGPFEELLYDLIVAEAARHGIPPLAIEWDHRTWMRDGGRDIVVRCGHGDPNPRFIPQHLSIWSAKSGKAGIKPASLKKELTHAKHPKLREHLLGGGVYVWCALQPTNDPDAMREKVKEVAAEYNFKPDLVEFRWLPTLTTILNDHPGLIRKHFPHIDAHFEGVRNFQEWEQENRAGFSVEWVDFSSRSHDRDRIREHLRSRKGANVLHLAGLSGIGKTRTVFEACRGQRDLESVLYLPRGTTYDSLILHLTRNEQSSALVVIDEFSLEQIGAIRSRVGDFADRLRLVTISPARRNENSRPLDNIIVLSEPETRTGVLEIVRRAGHDLAEPVKESIANHAAHDLRLALLLIEASRLTGDFQNLPIRDWDGLWQRIVALFSATDTFNTYYRYLTTSIDLGIKGQYRSEVDYVAKFFEISVPRLDEIVHEAEKCGLGSLTPHFFEAAPRGLAIHLFRHQVWPLLSRRLNEFLSGLPSDRLLRRFIERCQECTGEERNEMEEALGHFFLAALGNPDLGMLADRERSRLFKTWAELDPARGLPWLEESARSASDEKLATFDVQYGDGGWGGRQQIVWLCGGLASFREHFCHCEAILFRLAQVETETGIANNSKGTWQGLFHPALASTEVPFRERLETLLLRVRNADQRTLPLIFGALVNALTGYVGLPIPPGVIGGRLTPEPWRPRTMRDLHELKIEAAKGCLRTIESLPETIRKGALFLVVENVALFINLGLMAELRSSLDTSSEDEELQQALRLALLRTIAFLDRRGHGDSLPVAAELLETYQSPASVRAGLLEELRRWSAELAPEDLVLRIKELTAQDYWHVLAHSRPEEVSTHE